MQRGMNKGAPKAQLDNFLGQLVAEVREGLKHGFFKCELTCELISGRKRSVTINAGKSHRYTIPAEELDS